VGVGSLLGMTWPSSASVTEPMRAATGTLSHSFAIGCEVDTHPAARRRNEAVSVSRRCMAAHSKLLIVKRK